MEDSARLQPGDIETEFGVPIPGTILPPTEWAKTAIKRLPEQGSMDWTAVFGRVAPLVLDLGCGNGRFVVSSAVRRPTHDHIGLDILPVVIRYATRRANQRGLHNVRMVVCGAYEFLEQYTQPNSVAEIHIYHPQPYHDPNEKHRRLMTPEFLLLVHDRLQHDGKLFLQTDDGPYWKYLCDILPMMFELHEQTGPWPEDPQGRTRREIMAISKRLAIFRGWCVPRDDISPESLKQLVSQLPAPRFESREQRKADKHRHQGRRRFRR